MNIFEKALNVTEAELNQSSLQLVEDLEKFDWLGFLRALLFTDGDALLVYANSLLVILQSFLSRIQLLPVKLGALLAVEPLVSEEKLSQRVVRADTALRFTLQEIIDTGFEIATGRFVPIYDVFKGINRVILKLRVIALLDSVAVLKLAKGTVVQIIIIAIKIVWAVIVGLATLVLVLSLAHKWKLLSYEKKLNNLFLANDSQRVRRWPKERLQYRVNLQPGPDKPS